MRRHVKICFRSIGTLPDINVIINVPASGKDDHVAICRAAVLAIECGVIVRAEFFLDNPNFVEINYGAYM